MTLSVPWWSVGWEMGRRGDLLPQGVQVPACFTLGSGGQQGLPPPAALRAASVTSPSPVADGWRGLTSFLLEGVPFPPAFSSLASLSSPSPGCRRLCRSRMRSPAGIGHINPACTHHVMGGSHGRGLQEGCVGTFPRLRSARAIWPPHLLAACSTLSSAYVLGWRLQPPHLSCVLLKEKLKGSCLAFQPCLMPVSSSPRTGEHWGSTVN